MIKVIIIHIIQSIEKRLWNNVRRIGFVKYRRRRLKQKQRENVLTYKIATAIVRGNDQNPRIFLPLGKWIKLFHSMLHILGNSIFVNIRLYA